MQTTSISVSVIIPTKNRPHDLEATIDSLLGQTRLPDELIVVDQSSEKSLTKPVPIPFRYIHDPGIRGAGEARNAAMAVARGNIWLFLDDDVLLESDFIHQLLAAYSPEVVGVSGIVTNYTKPPFGRLLWGTIFMRGPFEDVRQRIYWNCAELTNSNPIRVHQFTAALMSFRASALRGIRFDTNNTGASLGEDLDFCAQFERDSILLIAPKARLIHKQTPQARAIVHWLAPHAQAYYYLRERHWRAGVWNNVCFAWLKVGYALAAVISCVKRRSFDSWNAWRQGARRGVTIRQG